jgi:hypothetical protein
MYSYNRLGFGVLNAELFPPTVASPSHHPTTPWKRFFWLWTMIEGKSSGQKTSRYVGESALDHGPFTSLTAWQLGRVLEIPPTSGRLRCEYSLGRVHPWFIGQRTLAVRPPVLPSFPLFRNSLGGRFEPAAGRRWWTRETSNVAGIFTEISIHQLTRISGSGTDKKPNSVIKS